MSHRSKNVALLFAALLAGIVISLGQPALSARADAGGANCVQTHDFDNMTEEQYREIYENG